MNIDLKSMLIPNEAGIIVIDTHTGEATYRDSLEWTEWEDLD